MSQFLWVEDFKKDGENIVQLFTACVFGELLSEAPAADQEKNRQLLEKNGIFLECSFLDGLEFIRDEERFAKIDYIILDIQLAVQQEDEPDEQGYLPGILALYNKTDENKAREELENLAGYQLYIELVIELGFPREHILFCSNHFDKLKSLHATLDMAKLKLPPIPDELGKVSLIKEKDEAEIKKWVRERRDNPYSTFRRAVINGCEIIKDHLTDDNIQFLEFAKQEKQVPARVVRQDMEDYLSTLQKLLPLRPPGEDEKKHLYKIFVRALSHEWEDSFQPNTLKDNNKVIAAIQVTRTCARIIKAVRNWTAHTQLLDNLSECEAAFFFMVAMRAMFQLPDGKGLHGYEKTLCGLFKEPLSLGEMKALIDSGTELKKNLTDAYANLLAAYSNILNTKGKFEPPKAENIYFTSMLTDMQNTGKINKAHETDFDCVTGLFQMFWHGLSPMMVTKFTPVHDAASKKLRFEYMYDLKLDSYGKDAPDDFLFFLARSIYKRSFRPPT